MSFKSSLLVGTGVMALAGIVAFAQSGSAQGQSDYDLHQALCPQATAATPAPGGHLPDHFAQALSLTQEQRDALDQLLPDVCRLHQQVMNVLTPDQRTKLMALHGGHEPAAGFHAWLKKLHGG